MGIKVEHRTDGSAIGDTAYAAGEAQGSERRREQDRSYQLQQEVNAIREKARQDANARFFAQLQSQMQGRSDEMAFREKQYEELPQRQEQLGQIENDLQKDLSEWEFSRAQQQQLAKLTQARDYVTRNADGRYTADEQETLLRQIDEAELGIKPLQRKQTSWPKEQEAGRVWTDEATGASLTRDDKGNVKVLVKPDDSASFANQLKLKETIAKYAKDIFDTHQMSESPLSWEDALKTAQDFYSDMSGESQPPQGNEEMMADQLLQQMMSPETYAQAKATGLSSLDIYYMAQQLAQQETKEQGDIKKKQWMAKDDNFSDYRKRFAGPVQKSQIEDAYNNDPYVESNESALRQEGHEVTTPHSTWQELTKYQRKAAYKKYLKENKQPLSDRIGMKVARVISPGDYKNYEKKKTQHEAKLLTEEQFAQKAKDDPAFLWQYTKLSNKPAPVKIDSVETDMHRAIDSYGRPSYFGGM